MPGGNDLQPSLRRGNDGLRKLHALGERQIKHLARLAHGENAVAALFGVPVHDPRGRFAIHLSVLRIGRDHRRPDSLFDAVHRKKRSLYCAPAGALFVFVPFMVAQAAAWRQWVLRHKTQKRSAEGIRRSAEKGSLWGRKRRGLFSLSVAESARFYSKDAAPAP